MLAVADSGLEGGRGEVFASSWEDRRRGRRAGGTGWSWEAGVGRSSGAAGLGLAFRGLDFGWPGLVLTEAVFIRKRSPLG